MSVWNSMGYHKTLGKNLPRGRKSIPGVGESEQDFSTITESSIKKLDIQDDSSSMNHPTSILYKMSKKIAQLTKIIYFLNTKAEDHGFHIQSLTNAYEAEIAQISSEFQSRIDVLEGTLKVSTDKIDDLQENLCAKDRCISDLEGTVAQTQSHASQIQQRLEQDAEKFRGELTKVSHELEVRIHDLNRTHEVIEANLHAKILELEDARNKSDMSASHAALEQERVLQAVKQRHRDVLDSEQQEAERILHAMKRKLSSEIETLKVEHEKTLQAHVRSSDAKIQAIEETYQASSKEVQRLSKLRREGLDKIEHLDSKIQEKDELILELQRRLKFLDGSTAEQTQAIALFESKLADTNKELEGARSDCNLERHKNGDLKILLAKLKKSESAFKERLHCEIMSNEKLRAQCQTLEKETEILNQELTRVKSELKRLNLYAVESEAQKQRSAGDYKKLQSSKDEEIKQLQNQLDATIQKRQAQESSYKTLSETLTQESKHLSSVTLKLRTAETEISRLKDDIQLKSVESKNTIEKLQMERESELTRISGLNAQISSLQNLNNVFQEAIKQKGEEINLLESKMDATESQSILKLEEEVRLATSMWNDKLSEERMRYEALETSYMEQLKQLNEEHSIQIHAIKAKLEEKSSKQMYGLDVQLQQAAAELKQLQVIHGRQLAELKQEFKSQNARDKQEHERLLKQDHQEAMKRLRQIQKEEIEKIETSYLEQQTTLLQQAEEQSKAHMIKEVQKVVLAAEKNQLVALSELAAKKDKDLARVKDECDAKLKFETSHWSKQLQLANENLERIKSESIDKSAHLAVALQLNQKAKLKEKELELKLFANEASIHSLTAEIHDIKLEHIRSFEKIEKKHALELSEKFAQLQKEKEIALSELSEEHQTIIHKMLQDFESAHNFLKQDNESKAKLLVEAAYKYEHREPRDQDLRELEQLLALNSQLKSEIDKARVDLNHVRLELHNRDINFTKIFNKTPLVGGITQPVKMSTRSTSNHLRPVSPLTRPSSGGKLPHHPTKRNSARGFSNQLLQGAISSSQKNFR